MRLHHFAFAAFTALLLIGCSAPTPSPDTPQAAKAAPVAVTTPVTAPVATPPAATSPVAEVAPGFNPSAPNRSCKTDSDCVVKDVGNCCGAYPMCVNKDAKTDPAAVRAQCAKDGMASVCGFQEVSGCQCVKGQCENLTGGAAVM